MTRALVTGGTGFVGNCLARRLLREGHEVHLLLREAHAGWRIADLREHVRLHIADLGDPEGLRRTVSGIRPEWVFHLAVHGAYSSQTNVRQMLQTNVNSTANLLLVCLDTGFEAFVNTGSSSEYGFKDHAPSESEWLEPNSYYAVTKASATLFCRYAAQHHGARVPTLRLYSVYGPFEEPTRLMPTLVQKGLENRLPPLANPSIARDYVYVDDVCDAYLLAAGTGRQEPGAVYNVGTGTQTTLREVVDVARRVLGITAEPEWGTMPDRQWDTHVWVADSRRIRRELGWQPKFGLEEGLRTMADWFRTHPDLLAWYRTGRW